jgi:chaperonin cofactor prefoldin
MKAKKIFKSIVTGIEAICKDCAEFDKAIEEVKEKCGTMQLEIDYLRQQEREFRSAILFLRGDIEKLSAKIKE